VSSPNEARVDLTYQGFFKAKRTDDQDFATFSRRICRNAATMTRRKWDFDEKGPALPPAPVTFAVV
jgi:hypothetical protein